MARVKKKRIAYQCKPLSLLLLCDFRVRRNLFFPPVFSKRRTHRGGTLLVKRRVATTTSTTATEPLLFEVLDEGKNEIWLLYAYMALGNYRFIAAHVERERPAVSELVFIPSDGADARIGRA